MSGMNATLCAAMLGIAIPMVRLSQKISALAVVKKNEPSFTTGYSLFSEIRYLFGFYVIYLAH